MLTILYVIAACVVTPIALEFFNTTIQGEGTVNEQIRNLIKGWPAYALNVVVCTIFGLIVCALPKGPGFSLNTWPLVTFAIYFGNQFVYNTFIKTLAKAREKVGI